MSIDSEAQEAIADITLGREDTMPEGTPHSDEELGRVVERLRSFGLNAVSGRD